MSIKAIIHRFVGKLPPSNWWIIASLVSTIIISVPIIVVFLNIFSPGDDVWLHIRNELIAGYLFNTITLFAGVGVITFAIGVGTSWLITMYDFPCKRFLTWGLILPISIPAYILGFTWVGILDFTSPIYVFARDNFGIETGQFLFFNILSVPGAIIIFSLAFYPYVYLLTRAYFIRQTSALFETAASLGAHPVKIFFQVVLPLTRPATVAGISLVLMEILNDYGLVRYFGVHTISTGIFTAWFSFSNPDAALKLSSWLLVIVLVLLGMERFGRRNISYGYAGNAGKPVSPIRLKPLKGLIASAICVIPVSLGFLFPVAMLIYWSIKTVPIVIDSRFWELFANSFFLAGMAAVIIVTVAILIAYTVRSFPGLKLKLLAKTATLGYALPGAVVAIGILVPLLWIDSRLLELAGDGVRITLTGTWFALLYAYFVRFMAVGYNSIDSGLDKIPRTYDHTAQSLGFSQFKILKAINLPLLKASVAGAAILVFIDVLKELPLTLILRPFNFDTLAIRAFEFATDGRIAEAAPPSLIIILVGMIQVLLINRFIIVTNK